MTNQPSAPGIAFRRLSEDDLPRMQRWLSHPPVKQWYDDPSETLEMVRDSYGPSIAGLEPTQPFIFAIEGRPAGYIQSYRPKEWPEYWSKQHLSEGAVGIDLFIGEDDFRHRGFGPLVIDAFIERILAPDSSVTEIIIDPDPANRIAIRAYEKAGFVRLREIGPPEHGEPALLMVRPVHAQKLAPNGEIGWDNQA